MGIVQYLGLQLFFHFIYLTFVNLLEILFDVSLLSLLYLTVVFLAILEFTFNFSLFPGHFPGCSEHLWGSWGDLFRVRRSRIMLRLERPSPFLPQPCWLLLPFGWVNIHQRALIYLGLICVYPSSVHLFMVLYSSYLSIFFVFPFTPVVHLLLLFSLTCYDSLFIPVTPVIHPSLICFSLLIY